MSVSETATGVSRGYSPAQKGLDDLLRDRRRDCAAEAVRLLLEHDRDRDLRMIGGSEADEPRRIDVVETGFRRPGLAGNLDPRDLRRRARPARDDRLHELRQGRRRLRLDRAAETARVRLLDRRAVGP